MAQFDLVAFDLYGTLLDISGLAQRLVPFVGARAESLLAEWRKAQLDRTWALNACHRYEPFDEVTAAALQVVAPDLIAAMRAQMARIWLTVPAHRDAAATLLALGAAGVRTAILSNGSLPMIEQALAAAALRVDAIKSVDEVRVYKPDPRVYALLDSLAPKTRTLFVSSNAWDASGAKKNGLTVAYVNRSGIAPEAAPDFEVTSLSDLSSQLTADS